MKSIMVSLLIAVPVHAASFNDFFRGYCERHLIPGDWYPFEEFTNAQLIEKFNFGPTSKALKDEMFYRLNYGQMTDDERETFEMILLTVPGAK